MVRERGWDSKPGVAREDPAGKEDNGATQTIARQVITPAAPGVLHRQVQKGQRERPPMVFSGDTEIVYRPDMMLFGPTFFNKRWPILKPTFKPLASGTFIVDGIPIGYSLEGSAEASSYANLLFGPGFLHEIRVIVTGPEAERMRKPKITIIPPIIPPIPPIILTSPPDRNPKGTFGADAYLRFPAVATAGVDAHAQLDAGLNIATIFNAGVFAGLSGSANATASTAVNTFLEFTWADGSVSLSAVFDIDAALSLAVRLSAFAGVFVELRIPDIPVVTSLSKWVHSWPLIGKWVAPDLSRWRWRHEYRKDWPVLARNYTWNVTQRFTISNSAQTGSFPEADGFDMANVIRDLEAQQKPGDLKDDPEGPGKEKRGGDRGAVAGARAAALAQISSAKRAADREKKANTRLLAAAKKAAAKPAPAGGGPTPSLATTTGGPSDPVSQLEMREQKLDQALKSTDELRERADALNAPANEPDGVTRNEARAGFEAIAKNADVLGDKIDRSEDVFAVPAAAEPSDADYEKMKAARLAAYAAFDECFDPTRTEKLWADDQVRAAGNEPDLRPYRDAAVTYQGKALKLWNQVEKLEQDLEKAREWYEVHDHALGVKVFEELEAKAIHIKDDAASLQNERPEGDWDTDYVDLQDGKLILKPPYRGKATRSSFYPHDYSASTKNRMWVKIGGVTTGEDGKQYWEYRGKQSPRGDFKWLVNDVAEQPSLDHTSPTVVSHWNTSGSKTDYPPRRAFYDFTGADVVVVPQTLNSSAGGREPGSYLPYVTRAFRGAKT